jgi:hypothetical protein
MVGTTKGMPIKVVSRFVYAAGATGILANLFFIILYVQLGLQAGGSEDGVVPGAGPAPWWVVDILQKRTAMESAE